MIKLLYKFTKKISCDDPAECSINIMNKLETAFNLKLHGEKFATGHMSCNHEPHNHTFWIFLYDNNRIHESENTITKQIIKTPNENITKFNGPIPTQSQIESIF